MPGTSERAPGVHGLVTVPHQCCRLCSLPSCSIASVRSLLPTQFSSLDRTWVSSVKNQVKLKGLWDPLFCAEGTRPGGPRQHIQGSCWLQSWVCGAQRRGGRATGSLGGWQSHSHDPSPGVGTKWVFFGGVGGGSAVTWSCPSSHRCPHSSPPWAPVAPLAAACQGDGAPGAQTLTPGPLDLP